MRYIKTVIISALCVILFSGCAATVPEKLDSFVDKTEKASDNYTSKEWEKATNEYEGLLDEFIENYSSYSEEEVKVAADAIGRYHALLIKNGMEKTATFLKDMTKVLPSYLNGIISGFEEEASGLKSILESIDTKDIENTLDQLGNTIEDLFSGLEGK